MNPSKRFKVRKVHSSTNKHTHTHANSHNPYNLPYKAVFCHWEKKTIIQRCAGDEDVRIKRRKKVTAKKLNQKQNTNKYKTMCGKREKLPDEYRNNNKKWKTIEKGQNGANRSHFYSVCVRSFIHSSIRSTHMPPCIKWKFSTNIRNNFVCFFLLAFIVYIDFFPSSADDDGVGGTREEVGRDKRLAFFVGALFGRFVAFQIRLLIKYFANVSQE